jgi:hypothetical protein
MHEEGSMVSPLAVRYGVISLPYMMLIDPDGRVIKKNIQITQLEAELEGIFARKIKAVAGKDKEKENR